MLCPASTNICLSDTVEEKNSFSLESLNGHGLDRSCPTSIVIITTCDDAGDNQSGDEKFCISNPGC